MPDASQAGQLFGCIGARSLPLRRPATHHQPMAQRTTTRATPVLHQHHHGPPPPPMSLTMMLSIKRSREEEAALTFATHTHGAFAGVPSCPGQVGGPQWALMPALFDPLLPDQDEPSKEVAPKLSCAV